MTVQPYLFFEGRAEEAIGFYRTALDAKVEDLMRFKDAPPAPPGQQAEGCAPMPGSGDAVMHASIHVGDAVVMLSDGMCQGKASFQGFSLAVTVPDEATADRYFGALAEGGEIRMPLGPTFFAKKFGMVADKFGVAWMIMLPQG